MKIAYQILRPEEAADTTPPVRIYKGDAGYDLTASRDMLIEKSNFAAVPTNLAIAIPTGMWAILVGRSSTFYRRGLLVNSGIIDAGYRGELMALAYNLGTKGVIIRKGERLFQLILMPALAEVEWEEGTLPKSERAGRGIGSSGAMGDEK